MSPSGASSGTSSSVAERFVEQVGQHGARGPRSAAGSRTTCRRAATVAHRSRPGTRRRGRRPRRRGTARRSRTPGAPACTASGAVSSRRRPAPRRPARPRPRPRPRTGSTPSGEPTAKPTSIRQRPRPAEPGGAAASRVHRGRGSGSRAGRRRKSSRSATYSTTRTTDQHRRHHPRRTRTNVRSRCGIASRLVRLDTGQQQRRRVRHPQAGVGTGPVRVPRLPRGRDHDRGEQHDGRVEADSTAVTSGGEQEDAGEAAAPDGRGRARVPGRPRPRRHPPRRRRRRRPGS